VEGRPPDDVSDDVLIRSALAGDDEAFAVIVRRYEDIAFRTAFVVLRDGDAAADAVQEGMVRAHRALSRFRREAPLKPWLLRIIANRARSLARQTQRHEELALAAYEAHPPASPQSAEDQLTAAEEQQELMDAVNELSERDRVAIGLYYFLELPEREIAEILSVRLGTVKSRLHRARGHLRDRLERGST
jgi:RNA polymerase sigma-70 factor (ECF subfamily)